MKVAGKWQVWEGRRERLIAEGENIITSAGFSSLLALLHDGAGQRIEYISIGTGTGTPSQSDTALFAELHQEQIVLREVSGNKLTVSVFILAQDATAVITEAGAKMTDGTLFSHWLLSIDNTASPKDLTIDYSVEVANG